MEKEIKVGAQDVRIEFSADTLRVYRRTFQRDLLQDLQQMTDHLNVEVMENMLWVAARAADPDIPDIDEWLKQFGPFDVIHASGAVLQAWNEQNETTSTPKKKVTP